jgi:hypothetical protein
MIMESNKAATPTTIESEEFYNLMQTYRFADMGQPAVVGDSYSAVIAHVDARLAAHDDLVKALQGEHKACDWLMARLIALDPNFMPTKSPVWKYIEQGSEALSAAGAA